MRMLRAVVVLTAATFLMSCRDAPSEILGVSGAQIQRQRVEVSNEREAEGIARGIAAALRDPELRILVRDAMRASPYNEHKLVLQDFLNTREGSRLFVATAAQLHRSERALRQELQALPALDFYLPVRSHRRNWAATEDILVGAAFFHSGETTIDLVGVDGNKRAWPRQGMGPNDPVIILHPAERKSLRTPSLPSQRSMLSTVSMLESGECDPLVVESCEPAGGGGGYPITPGVYIDHFNPQNDDGWFGGVVEIRFNFNFDAGQDTAIRRDQPPFVGSDELILVSARPCIATSPPPFTLKIVEEDPLEDDDWGTQRFSSTGLAYGVHQPFHVDGNLKIYVEIICR